MLLLLLLLFVIIGHKTCLIPIGFGGFSGLDSTFKHKIVANFCWFFLGLERVKANMVASSCYYLVIHWERAFQWRFTLYFHACNSIC